MEWYLFWQVFVMIPWLSIWIALAVRMATATEGESK